MGWGPEKRTDKSLFARASASGSIDRSSHPTRALAPHPPLRHEGSLTHARTDCTRAESAALVDLPFADLLFEVQTVHRVNHTPNTVQRSQLLSIKTGGCAQDCGYCSQSASFDTGLRASKLMDTDAVRAEAAAAKAGGATRFCMGAAWTGPKDRDLSALTCMVAGVKALASKPA